MKIEYDRVKSEKNLEQRGLSFDMVLDLDWSKAIAFADERRDYGEKRIVALVPMQGRLYFVCYTMKGSVRRIISFRRANAREARHYEEETADR